MISGRELAEEGRDSAGNEAQACGAPSGLNVFDQARTNAGRAVLIPPSFIVGSCSVPMCGEEPADSESGKAAFEALNA